MENFPVKRGILDLPPVLAAGVAAERTLIVGIDGGAGSGKTTFARWLASRLDECGVGVSTVHLDSFCRPVAERVAYPSPLTVIEDLDWQRLRSEVIAPLRSGRGVRFQLYDWVADCLRAWQSIVLGGVVLIDGVTALRTELRDCYDLRIWLSCPRELRVTRVSERGDTSDAEMRHWVPSEDQYIAEHDPSACAHVVVASRSGTANEGARSWDVIRGCPPGT